MEGCAGQRCRRDDRGAGGRGPDQHRLRREPAKGSPRCSPCSSSCAAGVTVVGIDNGYRGGVRGRPDAAVPARDTARVVPLLRRASPGDMALGSLLDAGADAGRGAVLLVRRVPLRGWDLRTEAGPARAASPARGPIVSSVTTSWCAPTRRHRRAGHRGTASRTGGQTSARATFAALAEVEGTPAPAATRPGPLPRGGRARRGRRRGRDRGGPRGPRGRPGHRLPGGHGDRHGAHRPRPASQPIPGGRSGSSHGVPTYGRDVRVELTTPTGAALLATLSSVVRPDARHDGSSANGFGAGQQRARRPAQLHPGGGRLRRARTRGPARPRAASR